MGSDKDIDLKRINPDQGIREQMDTSNLHSYSSLSRLDLEEMLIKMGQAPKDPDGRRFTLFTGQAGAQQFDKAINEDLEQVQAERMVVDIVPAYNDTGKVYTRGLPLEDVKTIKKYLDKLERR